MASGGEGELVELVQGLIRNACVSSGFPSTGEEHRNAALLRGVLEASPLDLEEFEAEPGRPSLVARLEGSDPDAPSLCLLGHTDVVPADREGWREDPFGGELIDGEVWGRGAVDMLDSTAAMALAVRRLADTGFRPRGTLVFAAVPDEECGGLVGARALLEARPDLVRTDYALTEVGGAVRPGPRGPLIEAYVADKGVLPLRVTVRGTPRHSSLPWGADNALVKAAEVVRRLQDHRPPTRIGEEWRAWVAAQDFPAELAGVLVDPGRLWDALPSLPPDLAATAHACTHCTVVPTVVAGGEKTNTIPGRVDLSVSVRPALGDDPEQVLADLRGLLAGLVDPGDVEAPGHVPVPAVSSPTDTPLWPVLEDVVRAAHSGARLLPAILPAQTDARWLRPAGVTVYDFGLLSAAVDPREYWSRFHGRDERIDVASLALSLHAFEDVARRFLG